MDSGQSGRNVDPGGPAPNGNGDNTTPTPARRRTGRRPGDSGSRQAILTAARIEFGRRGYESTTIRGIARHADVDPALVHHFFLSKEGVFAAAMQEAYALAGRLPDILEPGLDGVGERLVRLFLVRWEGGGEDNPLLGIIRSSMSYEESARMLRDFVGADLLGRLSARTALPRPELRAGLVGAQLVGLVMMRYVVRVPPLVDLTLEEVVAIVGPTVQHYLAGDLGPPEPAGGAAEPAGGARG
jgi:AcrR family transcriptional regulator